MSKTLKEAEGVIKNVNRYLKEKGLEVRLERRYTYHAIDLYRTNGDCMRTISTGMTKSEAYEFAYAMAEGMGLLTYGSR